MKRNTIIVKPGDSIQEAIDRAEPGTRIYVLAGTYSEPQNPTNGLTISKNGIKLEGQKTKKKQVVFENAGNQRNGIVVVPPMVSDCMSCHASMEPPFELLPGVELTPGFLADQSAKNNRVVGNTLVSNGTAPPPGHPFNFAAADLTLISQEPSNCYADNVFTTFFSLFFPPPPCP